MGFIDNIMELNKIKEIENLKTQGDGITSFDFKRDFLKNSGIDVDTIVTGYKVRTDLSISGYVDQTGSFVIKLPPFITKEKLNDTHCHFIEFWIHHMISMYQMYKKVFVLKSDKQARKYHKKHCDNMFWIKEPWKMTKDDFLWYIRKDIIDAYGKMQEEEQILCEINEERRKIYSAILDKMIPFLEKTYNFSNICIEIFKDDNSTEIIPYNECEISIPVKNRDWHIQWFTTDEVESDLRLMKVRANVVMIVRKTDRD